MTDTAERLVEQARDARRYGDGAASLLFYSQAASAYADHPAGRAHCLRHMADLLRETGQLDDARKVLAEAETLYHTEVDDTLSLANTIRLRALVEGDSALWKRARVLYERAAEETGFDLQPAMDECDQHASA